MMMKNGVANYSVGLFQVSHYNIVQCRSKVDHFRSWRCLHLRGSCGSAPVKIVLFANLLHESSLILCRGAILALARTHRENSSIPAATAGSNDERTTSKIQQRSNKFISSDPWRRRREKRRACSTYRNASRLQRFSCSGVQRAQHRTYISAGMRVVHVLLTE